MGQIYTVKLFDLLGIIDILATNQNVVSLNDTLAFIDDIAETPQILVFNINDHLNINQTVSTSGAVRSLSVNQTLDFGQKVTKVYDIDLKDKLLFIQNNNRIYREDQNLVLTETFTINAANGVVSDTLVFTETLIGNHIWSAIHVNDTLTFTDHGTIYNIPNNGRAYDQIYTPVLSITRNTNIFFSYGNNTLSLRNPSFGNTYKYDYNRQQLETRGKQLIIAADSTYQYQKSVKTFSFTIEYLKQKDRLNLYTFFNNSIGQPIYMIDYEDLSYNVLITTPELEFTQQDINNYSISFDMEIVDDLGPVSHTVGTELSILYIANLAHLTN